MNQGVGRQGKPCSHFTSGTVTEHFREGRPTLVSDAHRTGLVFPLLSTKPRTRAKGAYPDRCLEQV